MKKILFKAHSPFTIFTSAIIGELYYKEDYKILIMGNPVDDGFEKRVKLSNFFQEVVCFNQNNKSVIAIEKCVDDYLNRDVCIDEYFMCVFSDGYSNMLAYRLWGNAKLHVFPEGCASLKLKERIDLVFNEVYGKQQELRSFFDKYPINLEMFDFSWVYDSEIKQGFSNMGKKIIDIKSLFKFGNGNEIVRRMNILFDCEKILQYDFFLLDDGMVAENRLDIVKERKTLELLFDLIKNHSVLVKAHPGNDKYLLHYRYSGFDVTFFEKSNVPWEVLLLNWKNCGADSINIIMPIFATSMMSTMYILDNEVKVNVLTLQEIFKKDFDDYLKKAIILNDNYYIEASAKRGINLFLPQNEDEMIVCVEKMLNHKIDHTNIEKKKQIDANYNYFQKIGNLISKSIIYSDDNEFYSTAWFSFINNDIEITFDINKKIRVSKIIWKPSDCNLFSAARNIIVSIENNNGETIDFFIGEPNVNCFFENGRMDFCVSFNGECKYIYIKACLMVDKKYCSLNYSYFDSKWRENFWEKWYYIVQNNLLNNYIINNQIRNVWIYGSAKIGKTIYNSLIDFGVEIKYIVSNKINNSGELYTVEEAIISNGIPDIMIITPMYDFDSIYYQLPLDLKGVTLSLESFIYAIEDS